MRQREGTGKAGQTKAGTKSRLPEAVRARLRLTPTHKVMIGFLLIILVGSILLALPVSSASGKAVPYVDALFMAVTSTCVTGLVTMPVVTTWNTFGHVVILLLIQIGGLGVITVCSIAMIYLHRRIGLRDRVLLQDAFNLNSLKDVIQFTRQVVFGTLVVEGTGALLYMTVFVPEFGAKGIWISVFNAVSAFCNAGIDIISDNSLCGYALNPMVNLTTCLLIILSGIGFIVWWDVIRVAKNMRKYRTRTFRHLMLHSKIAITATLVLIIGGALAIFVFEYGNPLTMGNCSLGGKIELSLFQSVTTRTAGFATIPQQNLTESSAAVCLLLMFIGGSPIGTAGGVKTVTFAVLIAAMISEIRNKNDVVLFGRRISPQTVMKAVAVTGMSFLIVFLSTILLAAVTPASLLDVLYETVSATATVGLSRNLTGTLNTAGKWIIIVTMYLGRIGPISLAVAFNVRKRPQNIVKVPTEEISVG